MYAEENHQKIIKIGSLLQQQLCYTQTDIASGYGPANRDNRKNKLKPDNLPSFACELCNKTVQVNSKRLMCTHCKRSVHLQCSTLKPILS